MKKIICAIFTLAIQLQLYSQNQLANDFTEMSLEELMNVKVTVATRTETSLRETPGVITVISRDDMARIGARDLVDVFQLLVPGFAFGVDVEGVVGIGFRGIWGHEGRILLMIDGIEMNEELFATTQFGNHYPVENIERVEIIRGPGSAIYGGFAEIGVVNIITRTPSNGAYAGLSYSQMEETYSHRNLGFGMGKQKGDFTINLNTVLGQGTRSDRANLDYYRQPLDMAKNSALNIFNTNLNLKYKGLDFRAIYDDYQTTQIDLWDANYTSGPLSEYFRTMVGNLQYQLKLGEKITLSPRIQYKYQQPWILSFPDEVINGDTIEGYSNTKYIGKLTTSVTGNIAFSEKANLIAGLEYVDNSVYRRENDETFRNNKNRRSLNNISAYAQFMWYTRFANITMGGRFDNSNEFGSSFVPRLGLTKAFEAFHLKLMLSQSFRVPGGIIPERVIPGAGDIEPEKSTNIELEAGYKISEKVWLIVNGFSINFDKPISYYSDPVTGSGNYGNLDKLGSIGVEAELKIVDENINFNVNYAHYKATDKIDLYKVPGQDDYFLGFARNRVNSNLSVRMARKVWFCTNISVFGKRFGFTHADENGADVLDEFDTLYMLGMNFRFVNFLTEGLNVTIGGHNLLNEKYSFIQPYKGAHSDLPAQSISGFVKLAYAF